MGVVHRHAIHRLGSVRRWVERKSKLLLIVLVLMLLLDLRGRRGEIGKHILVLALVVLIQRLLRVRILRVVMLVVVVGACARGRTRCRWAVTVVGLLAVFGRWI